MSNQFFHKLRFTLFSPDSKVELFVRSLYHRLAATHLNFLLQNWFSKRSYKQWLAKKEDESLPEADSFTHQPKITFILKKTSSGNQAARTTIKSIQNLSGENWEVLLISGDQEGKDHLNDIGKLDYRVKHVTPEQDDILAEVQGDFIIFCLAGDRFSRRLLIRFYQMVKNEPAPDLTYYDCEVHNAHQKEPTPFFKPATISPALLLSTNFLSRGIIKLTTFKEIMGNLSPETSILPFEYNFGLRLYENDGIFAQISDILVSQIAFVEPSNPEIEQVITDHLSRKGLQNVSADQETNGVRFSWHTAKTETTIIIPTKNNKHLLKPLLDSIFTNAEGHNLKINIVDNNSDDPSTLAYYETLRRKPNFTIIPYHEPFNYSKAINLGVSEADTELILLMNDDMKIKTPNWLDEMSQWALRSEIGVVGAKLLRANHTIQHAGIVLGLSGFMGHIYLNAPEDYWGLLGSVNWYRNFLAVTGACQMMRHSLFNQVGGYDEGYMLAFGDIDFCIRIHELGYQNIYTPFAELYHFEGKTRGYTTPVDDILLGFEKMSQYVIQPDPFFSPNLSYSRIPKCELSSNTEDARKAQIETRKQFYLSKQ